MDSNTQLKLIDFINQVVILAQGVTHLTGTQSAGELIDAAEELKRALLQDDTIVE